MWTQTDTEGRLCEDTWRRQPPIKPRTEASEETNRAKHLNLRPLASRSVRK